MSFRKEIVEKIIAKSQGKVVLTEDNNNIQCVKCGKITISYLYTGEECAHPSKKDKENMRKFRQAVADGKIEFTHSGPYLVADPYWLYDSKTGKRIDRA